MSFRSHRLHSIKSKEEIIAEIESNNKFNVLNTTIINDRVSTVFLEIKLLRFYTSTMILSITFSEVDDYKTDIFVEIFSPAKEGASDFNTMDRIWREIKMYF